MKPKNSLTNNPDIIEIQIDSLSYHGGRGVGRLDGIVVFVPHTAPGDLVRARVTAKKSRLWEAEALEVLRPSVSRRSPPCPVAGRCGGCSWQHVAYEEQLRQKQKILLDSVHRLSRYGEWQRLDFIRAPDEFHYRNRVQIHFAQGCKGFFAPRSRDLVAIDKCWIADPRLNEKLGSLAAPDGSKVEIALEQSGEVRVMPNERDPEAALFSQVNQAQNEILKQRLLDFIEIDPVWILDLYAGAGNLTTPLAERYPDRLIYAIELSRRSVERGKSALPKVRWISADVARGLKQISPLPPGPGLVVVDPPRHGLENSVVEQLRRLRPQQIIYVSCNPSTFARDAEKLMQDGLFRMKQLQGLDMFPQTEHVELIASLCSAI